MVLFGLQEGEGHRQVTPEPAGGHTDPCPLAVLMEMKGYGKEKCLDSLG